MNRTKNRVIGISIIVGDFLIFYLSLYLALFIRKMGTPDSRTFTDLQEPFLYLFFIWVFLLFATDLYEVSSFKRTVSFLRGVIVFSLLAAATGTVYFYFQPQLGVTPRAVLFLTVLNFALLAFLWRSLFSLVIGLKNFRKKIFFIGFCDEMKEIVENDSFNYEIVGIYTKAKVPRGIEKRVTVIRSILDVKKAACDAEALVLAPGIREDKNSIKTIFSSLPLNMRYIEFFTLYEEITKKVPLRSINEWWFLENISRPRKKVGEVVNRCAEATISFFGVIFLGLIFPLIALLITIDSGTPLLYRQKRVGERGRKFVLYKFRTMHCVPEKEDVPWREKKKGEVTRVGSFLRKTHLDELPQLYNIMRGDLSFVGPRPETTKLASKFEEEIPFYKLRYLVRPGLTGWAQINYPPSMSVEEAEEKFKYDLYYIKNRSFLLDLIIILKTLRTTF